MFCTNHTHSDTQTTTKKKKKKIKTTIPSHPSGKAKASHRTRDARRPNLKKPIHRKRPSKSAGSRLLPCQNFLPTTAEIFMPVRTDTGILPPVPPTNPGFPPQSNLSKNRHRRRPFPTFPTSIRRFRGPSQQRGGRKSLLIVVCVVRSRQVVGLLEFVQFVLHGQLTDEIGWVITQCF